MDFDNIDNGIMIVFSQGTSRYVATTDSTYKGFSLFSTFLGTLSPYFWYDNNKAIVKIPKELVQATETYEYLFGSDTRKYGVNDFDIPLITIDSGSSIYIEGDTTHVTLPATSRGNITLSPTIFYDDTLATNRYSIHGLAIQAPAISYSNRYLNVDNDSLTSTSNTKYTHVTQIITY